MESIHHQHNELLTKITRFFKAETLSGIIAARLPGYKTFQNKLEYESIIWHRYQNYLTSKLQPVKNKAADLY